MGGPAQVRTAGAVADTGKGADVEEATAKTCTGCKRKLGLDGFYRDKRAQGGYRANCKSCHKADVLRRQQENADSYRSYQRRWREAHKRQTLEYAAQYRAANSEKIRADAELYRSMPENRQVARQRAGAFRRANPALRTEYERRRRARKLATAIGRITPEMLTAKFAHWGNRCWMCGGAPDEADHVKPLTKGGWHVLANIRPACRSCNASKSDRWPFPVGGAPRRRC